MANGETKPTSAAGPATASTANSEMNWLQRSPAAAVATLPGRYSNQPTPIALLLLVVGVSKAKSKRRASRKHCSG